MTNPSARNWYLNESAAERRALVGLGLADTDGLEPSVALWQWQNRLAAVVTAGSGTGVQLTSLASKTALQPLASQSSNLPPIIPCQLDANKTLVDWSNVGAIIRRP